MGSRVTSKMRASFFTATAATSPVGGSVAAPCTASTVLAGVTSAIPMIWEYQRSSTGAPVEVSVSRTSFVP